MGTKNNPGKFDCYKNAEPDEPMFVLLGRDPMAGFLVRLWAMLRLLKGEDRAKVAEALRCARSMDDFAKSKNKVPVDAGTTFESTAYVAIGVLPPQNEDGVRVDADEDRRASEAGYAAWDLLYGDDAR